MFLAQVGKLDWLGTPAHQTDVMASHKIAHERCLENASRYEEYKMDAKSRTWSLLAALFDDTTKDGTSTHSLLMRCDNFQILISTINPL